MSEAARKLKQETDYNAGSSSESSSENVRKVERVEPRSSRN